MRQPIDLFPARIAIGTFNDAQGRRVDVTMTPEFFRALRDVLMKIGGPASDGGIDSIVPVMAPFVADEARAQPMLMVSPSALQSMVQQMVSIEMARFATQEQTAPVCQVMATGETNVP